MITNNAIKSFSKPEKLITQPEDLKVGHLYLLKSRIYSHIMIITNLEYDTIRADLVESTLNYIEYTDYQKYFNMGSDTISPVPEIHKHFNQDEHYAYYEIGPKENYPEYFL
jgi:hypothetical protein